jgi:hypothetical protein
LVDHDENVITGTLKRETLEVKIFPNPANGKFIIQLPSAGFDTVEMYDITGNVVHRSELSSHQTQLELNPTLASGIYLVRLANKHRVLFSKVMIE